MSDAIRHISDTALLVAAERAAETELEDGLVRDPYAARLAGERGMAIARSGSPSRWRSFGIGLRARFIDEFLLNEVGAGTVDCIVSLGAGLDARPWRLPLPSHLRWIEVDFAPLLDYKYGILKDAAASCRLEQINADLNEKADRQQVLEAAFGESSRVLLLTEGILFYLPADTVSAIAAEMADCYRWVLDISPCTSLLMASGGGGESMRQANDLRHATRLEGAAILEVVANNGWAAAASKRFVKDGVPYAIQRMRKNGWVADPDTPRPSPDDPAGVWVFQRAN